MLNPPASLCLPSGLGFQPLALQDVPQLVVHLQQLLTPHTQEPCNGHYKRQGPLNPTGAQSPTPLPGSLRVPSGLGFQRWLCRMFASLVYTCSSCSSGFGSGGPGSSCCWHCCRHSSSCCCCWCFWALRLAASAASRAPSVPERVLASIRL